MNSGLLREADSGHYIGRIVRILDLYALRSRLAEIHQLPDGTIVETLQLEMHHRVEDDYYFPTFAAAAPKLQKGFDILDNDHGVIHSAIYSLGTASRELIAALSGEVAGRDGDAPRVAERLAGEIEGFDRTLLRHLEDEEDLIIPLILERTRDDPNFR